MADRTNMNLFTNAIKFLLLVVICLSEASAVLPAQAYLLSSGGNGTVPANGSTMLTPVFITQEIASGAPISYRAEVKNTSGFPSCANGMYINISASSTANTGEYSANFDASSTTEDWQYVQGYANTNQTIETGNYYIRAHTQCNPGNFEIRNVSLQTGTITPSVIDLSATSSYFTRILDANINTNIVMSTVEDNPSFNNFVQIDDTSFSFEASCSNGVGLEIGIFLESNQALTAQESCTGSTETYVENEVATNFGNYLIIAYDPGNCTTYDECLSFYGSSEEYLIFNRSSDIVINSTYHIETSEIITTRSERNPTLLSFKLARTGSTTEITQSETIDNTIQGEGSATTTFSSLQDGYYTSQILFSNFGCALETSPCPFPLSYLYLDFQILNGEAVNISQVEQYNNVEPVTDLDVYEDCSLTNVSGCISNSLRFLFTPSQSSVEELVTLKDTMDTRIPFVYVSDIKNVADEIFNSQQQQSLDVQLNLGFGTIDFINEDMIANAPQASTIRALLSAMLWVVFAIGAYRMALGIHNKETT